MGMVGTGDRVRLGTGRGDIIWRVGKPSLSQVIEREFSGAWITFLVILTMPSTTS